MEAWVGSVPVTEYIAARGRPAGEGRGAASVA